MKKENYSGCIPSAHQKIRVSYDGGLHLPDDLKRRWNIISNPR
jgi:hypothetical protein